MWGKIIIPMYRLWLNGLYGPRCPLSSKRPINLIYLSLKLDLPKGEHIQLPTGYAIVPHIDEYAGDVTLLSIPHTQGRPVLMQGYLKNRGSKMYIRP